MTRMTLTTPTIVARAQKRKMTVATCVSANGKPPSVIRWETKLKGEATFQETRNQNGTVTVRSNYALIPSRETHKQRLTCIVTYRAEKFTDSVVLNVQCKSVLFESSFIVLLLHFSLFVFIYQRSVGIHLQKNSLHEMLSCLLLHLIGPHSP